MRITIECCSPVCGKLFVSVFFGFALRLYVSVCSISTLAFMLFAFAADSVADLS